MKSYSFLRTSAMIALSLTFGISAAQAETAEQTMNRIISEAGNAVVNDPSTRLAPTLTADNESAAGTNAVALNTAVSGAAKLVILPAGNFYVSSEIKLNVPGIVLRGAIDSAGKPATKLLFTRSLSQMYPSLPRSNWHGTGGVITLYKDSIKVENLSINFPHRSKFALEDGYNVFNLRGAACIIKNMVITNFEIGVSVAYKGGHLIQNIEMNSVHGAHFGVLLGDGANHVKVSGIHSVGTIAHDLGLQKSSSNAFINCEMRSGSNGSTRYDGISFRGSGPTSAPNSAGSLTNNVFKDIIVDDTPLGGNNAWGSQYDSSPTTFGHCYYSNVKQGNTPFTIAKVPGTLINFIHFVGSSTPANSAPVVSAGADKFSTMPAVGSVVVALAGTVTDADGDVTTKQWAKVSGAGTVTFSAATASATNATISAAGTYVLSLTANDGKGHVVTDTVQVVVSPYVGVNVAPVVSAGADKSATMPAVGSVVVALAGTVTDADGDVTTKQWAKVSGAGTVTFSAATASATNATISAAGTYVVSLTANDGHGHVVTDTMQLVVSPYVGVNVAPVVSAGADKSATMPATGSVVVALAGTVTDADGDVTTKQWAKVSGTGTVTFSAATALATNVTISAAGTYVVSLTANDGHGHVVTDTMQLVVNPYIASTFVRRINLNGAATTIGGNAWTAYTTALGQGLTIVPAPLLATTALTPVSPVDVNTKNMLNSAIWNSKSFTINQALPTTNGNYTVTLWLMENYKTNFRSFHVSLEGIQVTKVNEPIGAMALNTWAKYTYNTTVKDGQLNIGLIKVTGDPGLMGIEIVSVSSFASLAHPSDLLSSWMSATR